MCQFRYPKGYWYCSQDQFIPMVTLDIPLILLAFLKKLVRWLQQFQDLHPHMMTQQDKEKVIFRSPRNRSHQQMPPGIPMTQILEFLTRRIGLQVLKLRVLKHMDYTVISTTKPELGEERLNLIRKPMKSTKNKYQFCSSVDSG